MEVEVRPIVNGIMVWWNNNDKAAKYNVCLYIGEAREMMVYGRYNVDGEFVSGGAQRVEKQIIERVHPLCIVEKDRLTFYHTFTGLADNINFKYANGQFLRPFNNGSNAIIKTDFYYFVKVEAEDREGKVIEKSEMVMCNPIKINYR